ncbi:MULTISPECIES: hypothetical protein [unclassified Variovorax]|uniref:hypothetical protein n=1 Tax=unclassified Variovorax TaxID=663243 RepID=UPI001BD422CE|nr:MULTISPECIES: hypothetical protein [unclassified Variovorax]
MRMLALSIAIASSQLLALGAQAQTTDDKAAAKAERRKEGAEAAKNPLPAEGIDPIPAARPKSSSGDKAAARTERKVEGSEASKNPLPAEGIETVPTAKPKVSASDKAAARKARRDAAAKANKAGELKPQNF